MALLIIRDKDGNITEVPALKGDKGEQGEKGHSGIYTGDGQPPEGYDVWVDTNENYQEGAYVSFETQNLTNVQKEIARENISAMVNKEWKVIATGEITEDGVTKIAITKDNNGNPFEIYDALVVYTNAPIAAETANIFIYVNGQPSNLAFQALHKSAAKFARITANWDGGNWAGISLVAGNSYSYVTNVGGMTQYNAKRSPATKIELGTENANAPFPIGTKFELRGVVKV